MPRRERYVAPPIAATAAVVRSARWVVASPPAPVLGAPGVAVVPPVLVVPELLDVVPPGVVPLESVAGVPAPVVPVVPVVVDCALAISAPLIRSAVAARVLMPARWMSVRDVIFIRRIVKLF